MPGLDFRILMERRVLVLVAPFVPGLIMVLTPFLLGSRAEPAGLHVLNYYSKVGIVLFASYVVGVIVVMTAWIFVIAGGVTTWLLVGRPRQGWADPLWRRTATLVFGESVAPTGTSSKEDAEWERLFRALSITYEQYTLYDDLELVSLVLVSVSISLALVAPLVPQWTPSALVVAVFVFALGMVWSVLISTVKSTKIDAAVLTGRMLADMRDTHRMPRKEPEREPPADTPASP